jgi:hypothetical protein
MRIRPPPVLAGLRSAGADGLKILDVRRLRSRQVSKISVCSEHRKEPGAKRRDPDCGSPFFGLLSFGEAKESRSPAAAMERLRDSAKNPGADPNARLRQAQPERFGVQRLRYLSPNGKGQDFDKLSPNGLGGAPLRQVQPERVGGAARRKWERNRKRAFWGSEHKFPEPAARPAGAALRCASLRSEIVIRPQKPFANSVRAGVRKPSRYSINSCLRT